MRDGVWPSGLAAFYPYPESELSIVPIAASALLLAVLTATAWRTRRRYPVWTVGWLWFLISLAPMSGLIRFGDHARADRFMYLPLIGLLWPIARGLTLAGQNRRLRRIAIALSVAALTALSLTAHRQVRHWRSSETLWARVMDKTDYNAIAPMNRAAALMDAGRWDEADPFLREALKLDPDNPRVHYNLGWSLLQRGQPEAADEQFLKSRGFEPLRPGPHVMIGRALARREQFDEAEQRFLKALSMQPDFAEAYIDLAGVYAVKGREREARDLIRRALQLAPGHPRAQRLQQLLTR